MNFLPDDAASPDERDADDAHRFDWKSRCESRNLAETRISFSECSEKETFLKKPLKPSPENFNAINIASPGGFFQRNYDSGKKARKTFSMNNTKNFALRKFHRPT